MPPDAGISIALNRNLGAGRSETGRHSHTAPMSTLVGPGISWSGVALSGWPLVGVVAY